jgi:hypothetical protein
MAERSNVEGCNDEVFDTKMMVKHHAEHAIFIARFFQFDVQQNPPTCHLKDFGKTWNFDSQGCGESKHFPVIVLGQYKMVECFIVIDQKFTVRSTPHVQFDHVRATLYCQPERLQSIFVSPGSVTAVGDDEFTESHEFADYMAQIELCGKLNNKAVYSIQGSGIVRYSPAFDPPGWEEVKGVSAAEAGSGFSISAYPGLKFLG